MIGELRQRLRIEEKSLVADEAGGRTETWVEVATVWASVSDESGNEIVSAEQIVPRQRVRAVIRDGIAPDESMRAILAGRVIAIRAIRRETPKRGYLTLQCEAQAPS